MEEMEILPLKLQKTTQLVTIWARELLDLLTRVTLQKENEGNCNVVIYSYILYWLYSMKKSVVIALILFLVFCGILLYWV